MNERSDWPVWQDNINLSLVRTRFVFFEAHSGRLRPRALKREKLTSALTVSKKCKKNV